MISVPGILRNITEHGPGVHTVGGLHDATIATGITYGNQDRVASSGRVELRRKYRGYLMPGTLGALPAKTGDTLLPIQMGRTVTLGPGCTLGVRAHIQIAVAREVDVLEKAACIKLCWRESHHARSHLRVHVSRIDESGPAPPIVRKISFCPLARAHRSRGVDWTIWDQTLTLASMSMALCCPGCVFTWTCCRSASAVVKLNCLPVVWFCTVASPGPV